MQILVQMNSGYYYPKWIHYLEMNSVKPVTIDLLQRGVPFNEKYEGLMWHLSMSPSILQAVEPILSPIEFVLGKNVFPDYRTRWHFENKYSQKYLLESLGTRIPATHCFWTKESALEWLESSPQLPVVHKKARGAGSANVHLLKTKGEMRKSIDEAFSPRGSWHQRGYYPTAGRTGLRLLGTRLLNLLVRSGDSVQHTLSGKMPHLPRKYWMPEKDCILFQEFLPDNEFDTRITIIGDRAFGFRRWNRPGDFRASGGGLLDHDVKGVDMRCVEIAFAISEKAGFQTMAYDFLFGKNREPVVCEISFGYQNKAVYQCSGHWNRGLRWIEGQMWPEEAHVQDFLSGF